MTPLIALEAPCPEAEEEATAVELRARFGDSGTASNVLPVANAVELYALIARDNSISDAVYEMRE